MAGTALRAKLGLVHVLPGMTINAQLRNLDQHRSAVAGLASSLCVSADEREPGLLGMVEPGIFPLCLVMAGLARAAEPALMNVLYGVAIIAGCRLTLIDFAKVTGGTGYAGVLAAQRESCLAMIKSYRVPPDRNAMTGLAFLSKIAHVRLAGIMAVKTGSRRLGPALGLNMTAGTGHIAMGTSQWKIRRGVIKSYCIDLYDIGITADVVVVTQVARHTLEQWAAAMEALMAVDIGAYRFMAAKAQLVLRGFGKWRMARIAIAFDLGMCCCDRAWHEQFLKRVVGVCRAGQSCHGHDGRQQRKNDSANAYASHLAEFSTYERR